MRSIGEIAKIVEVSVSTLRYYDEIGLLKPEHIDAESKYRYYTDEQISLILRIIELKKYGFSLDAIKNLLHESSEENIISAYKSKIEALSYDIKEVENSKELLLNRLESLLSSKDNSKTKILLVDDSEFLRTILKDILSKEDYEVIGEALNGQDGVNQYITHKPDLVLMDIGMPVMDGLEATMKIMDYDKKAKIVMCSAKSDLSKVLQAFGSGALDFIPKPFSQDFLIEIIKKALNRKTSFKEKFQESFEAYKSMDDIERILTHEEIEELIESINIKDNSLNQYIESLNN